MKITMEEKWLKKQGSKSSSTVRAAMRESSTSSRGF